MKLITAIIKPARFDNVQAALEDMGVSGITAAEVQGIGRQSGRSERNRGADYAMSFRVKVKVEVAVSDDQLEAVVEAITNAACSGGGGGGDDGRVFVTSLEQAIRIHTAGGVCVGAI